MIRALRWCLIAILANAGLAVPVLAAGHSTGGFVISVRVPEVCDVEAKGFVVNRESEFVVGEVMESCNHNRGFQILASHRPLEEGETVDVTYGEDQARLDQSGLSPIAFRAGARHGAVPVAISTAGLEGALQLSFSLTAV